MAYYLGLLALTAHRYDAAASHLENGAPPRVHLAAVDDRFVRFGDPRRSATIGRAAQDNAR